MEPRTDTGRPRARYVEALADPSDDGFKVFLAGGILGTENWQPRAFELLADLDVVVLNPRRACFPADDDDNAHGEQVDWEHRYLHEEPHRARLVVFWFPPSPTRAVQQPIVMYELGRLVERGTPIVVGASPAYVRRRDVVKQLSLSRPGLPVHGSLEATIEAARRTILALTG